MNEEPQILARWVDPTIDDLKTALEEANKQITILGNTIDKAIEYIKNNEFYLDYKTGACIKGVMPLLNILNGVDENG